ncbi:hypothetical protein SMCF_4113, partial [Streptomyces coelicoflavus ZG0656]
MSRSRMRARTALSVVLVWAA